MPKSAKIGQKIGHHVIPPPKKRNKPQEAVSKAVEDRLIADFIAGLPIEITAGRVQTLALKTKEGIREVIKAAREEFAQASRYYVRAHRRATEKAIQINDVETATKASAWAIEHIGEDKDRIVDQTKQATGVAPKVFVGIRLGGADTKALPAVTDVTIDE